MAPVSLCDEITLDKSDELLFDCNIRSISGDDNLCVRAAKAFFEKSGINSGVSIKLQKNIPFPAGLGGGSADAAAVLKGLNELYGSPLSMPDLFSIAEKLGSDISLCLLGRPALCEDKGDILTPVSNLPEMHVVIAIGDGRLSTPEVYRAYDRSNLSARNDSDAFLSALKSGDREAMINSCGNAFESVTDELCPETKLLRNKMLELGALTAHLSGSGPSVYGIFADEMTSSLVTAELQSLGYAAYTCNTL